MIGRIHGLLLEKQPPDILLDVNGVGYEIHAPMTTFYQLPPAGEEITLFTHLVVREDAHQLFGFYRKEERALFRMLIKVNGVGPKLALTILSGIEAPDFVNIVHHDDTAALVKLPGVGKKTAERLIIEMRDRLKDWQGELPESRTSEVSPLGIVRSGNALLEDAESALVALGYKPQEASRAVSAAMNDEVGSSEELIRAALKGMVRS